MLVAREREGKGEYHHEKFNCELLCADTTALTLKHFLEEK